MIGIKLEPPEFDADVDNNSEDNFSVHSNTTVGTGDKVKCDELQSKYEIKISHSIGTKKDDTRFIVVESPVDSPNQQASDEETCLSLQDDAISVISDYEPWNVKVKPEYELREAANVSRPITSPQTCLNLAGEALKDLQVTCDARTEENIQLREHIFELDDRYKKEIENLYKKISELQKANDNLNKKNELHEKENRKIQEDAVRSKEECTKIYKTLTQKNQTIITLEKLEKDLEQKSRNSNDRLNRLQDTHSKLQQQYVLETARNSKLQDENQLLSKRNKNLTREYENLRQELETTESELKQCNKQIRKLHGDIQISDNKVQTLTHNIASLSDEKNLLSTQNKEILNNLRTAMEKCSMLRHENIKLQDENQEKLNDIQNMLLKIDEVNGTANNEINAIKRELNLARERASALEIQLANCRETPRSPLPQSMTKLDSAGDTIKDLQKQLENSEKSRRELKKFLKLGTESRVKVTSGGRVTTTSVMPGYDGVSSVDIGFLNSSSNDEARSSDNCDNLNAALNKERDEYWRVRIACLEKENKKMKDKISKAVKVTSEPI